MALLPLLVYIVVVGVVAWLLFWIIDFVALPEPFNKVAKVVVALFAIIFLIDILLGLTGVAPSLRLR